MSTSDGPTRGEPDRPPLKAIEARLGELRRLIRSSAALRAVSLLAAAAAGLVLVSLAFDRAFRLPLAGRIAAQSLYAAILGCLAWKLLLRPLTRRLPDAALADLVERYFPHLLDRFRSAVEFARDPQLGAGAGGQSGPSGPSGPGGGGRRDEESAIDIGLVMKRRVVEEAARDAAALDASRIVDTPGVVTALVGGVAAVLAVVVMGALAANSFAIWCRRNILFEDVEWPYRTRLVVEGFPAETLERGVPRGDPLKILVLAEGEVPGRARIRIAYAREALTENLAREGDRTFVHEHAEVTEPFTFTVEGGDFRSRPHRVRVEERPEVKAVQVTVESPPYTGRPPQAFEGDIGELSVSEGSTIGIRGLATKPLARAWLETEERTIELAAGSGQSAAAGSRERAAPESFSGSYAPKAGGIVTVHLEDLDRIPPSQWFRFLVTPVPDRIPVVLARAEGIGSMITPVARIPFKVRATDDYGVVSIGIDHEVSGENQPVLKGSEAFPPLKAPGPAVAEEPAWEVGPLGIEPEKRLDVRISATDNDGLHGAKVGYAATQSFLVVTPERLGEEFLRREEEQRRLLERGVAEERAVRDASYRLVDEAWKAEGPLGDAVVKEMAGLTRTERQLARQVTGITGAMRLLLEEMKNNRMGEEEELARLVNAVIEPLTDIAERLLPAAAARIAAIREMESSQDRLKDGIALATDLETILQRMEAVLSNMKRLEGFTEVVNRLRGIIKVHEESQGEARKSYRREVDAIFEDPPAPAGGPPAGPGTGPDPPKKPPGQGGGEGAK